MRTIGRSNLSHINQHNQTTPTEEIYAFEEIINVDEKLRLYQIQVVSRGSTIT